jgi:hypothetical protein
MKEYPRSSSSPDPFVSNVEEANVGERLGADILREVDDALAGLYSEDFEGERRRSGLLLRLFAARFGIGAAESKQLPVRLNLRGRIG